MPRTTDISTRTDEALLRSSAAAFVAAEERDDVAAAEAALYGFFRHLPSPAPAADFAARVARRAGLRPAADLSRPARRWVMAALVATSLALALVLPPAYLLAGHFDWIGAFTASVGAVFGWIGAWIVNVFTAFDEIFLVGRAASVVGRAFRLVVASPEVLAALTLLFAVTALLVRALAQLVHTPRNAHAPL